MDTGQSQDGLAGRHIVDSLLGFGAVVHHPVKQGILLLDVLTGLSSADSVVMLVHEWGQDALGGAEIAFNLVAGGDEMGDDGMGPGGEHAQGEGCGEHIEREVDGEAQPFLVATGGVAHEDLGGHAGDEHAHHLLDVDFLPV